VTVVNTPRQSSTVLSAQTEHSAKVSCHYQTAHITQILPCFRASSFLWEDGTIIKMLQVRLHTTYHAIRRVFNSLILETIGYVALQRQGVTFLLIPLTYMIKSNSCTLLVEISITKTNCYYYRFWFLLTGIFLQDYSRLVQVSQMFQRKLFKTTEAGCFTSGMLFLSYQPAVSNTKQSLV